MSTRNTTTENSESSRIAAALSSVWADIRLGSERMVERNLGSYDASRKAAR